MGLLIAAEVEQARAEYPGGFSRPPSQGKDYNTWKDAQGPDVGVGKIDLNVCLPRSIIPLASSSRQFTNRGGGHAVSSQR